MRNASLRNFIHADESEHVVKHGPAGQFEDADDGQGDGGNEGANGHAHDGAANGEAANGGGINGALPHAPSS